MIHGVPKDDDSRYTQKIDVLDLLINILKEHEEKLEEQVVKMEKIAKVISEDPRFEEAIVDES